MTVRLIVMLNLILEEKVGLIVILNFFESEQADQAALKGPKESFDFTFSLGRRSHAMVDAQGAESTLKLRECIQAVVS